MPKRTIKKKNKLRAIKEGERKPKEFCEYCGEKLNLSYAAILNNFLKNKGRCSYCRSLKKH